MTKLDLLYAQLSSIGMIVLRQAVDSGNPDWVDAELEMLHNVPSLIGESNAARHRYYWNQERMHYHRWANEEGPAIAKSRMRTFYVPIWKEMEPLLTRMLDSQLSSS